MPESVRDSRRLGSHVRLNLGCGLAAPDGWTNLDRSPGLIIDRVPGLASLMSAIGVLPSDRIVHWPSNVRRWDVRRGLRYKTGSVQAIYTSHMLEHLSKTAADALLAECRRVLRADGVLRVAVPDLQRAVRSYSSAGTDGAADEFMRSTLLGVEDDPKGWGRLISTLSGSTHKWMYDAASLGQACLAAGFQRVERFGFHEGRCPDLANVETREDSVFVEAYVALNTNHGQAEETGGSLGA